MSAMEPLPIIPPASAVEGIKLVLGLRVCLLVNVYM